MLRRIANQDFDGLLAFIAIVFVQRHDRVLSGKDMALVDFTNLPQPAALSRAEVRRIDQIASDEFGISGLVLMENAGRNAAEQIQRRWPRGTVCILCGKGNNGGDGYVIARHLESFGRSVYAVSLAKPDSLSGDAAINYRIGTLAGIPIKTLPAADELEGLLSTMDVLVDCMLGTGAAGPPREPYATAIRIANRLTATRIAIDIPSGLDCDTGIPSDPTFQAAATITFVASKIGFANSKTTRYTGDVITVPIGIPQKLLDNAKFS